jgi:hypothetical protein
MTGTSYPDHDAASISSTNTFNSQDSNDSLFGLPLLAHRYDFDDSSDDESNPPSLANGSVSSSDDESIENYEVETVTTESSYGTANETDDISISTTES